MSYRDVEIACLGCRAPMRRHGQVSACETCGAAWMDTAEFLAMLREQNPQRAVDELLEHNDGTPRRPCPVCGTRMAIVWLDYLKLDQCADHGVWFNPDELPRALDGDVGAHWEKIGKEIDPDPDRPR